ncbi:transport and Golgi organization protein 2 [Labedella gwakjiensis]|uniref:Transport and Golgi organization protein 2 n=1 Tax=Labedella gwakjiensis TaxID=390269 RepID=A0A2P8GTY8_9MICO|nr:NRDE family protein [Labedella gwakjiensis]PSL37433.1 transport and Golgi organization protein 2 [Labedella gwakjiensis]RUQ84747.1 hypothetical protein ELQ93_14235 [Labedella gwakjiensis]
MCTVVVGFEPGSAWPVTLLGLRDEQPGRPWDPVGAWWPELGPSVRGLHDREAGGAWLASDDASARAAVVLNRREQFDEPAEGWTSRGVIPLAAVTSGLDAEVVVRTRTFNLVELAADRVRFTSWDGDALRSVDLRPGVHMITHEGPDTVAVPRVSRWAPRFVAAGRPTGEPGGADWDPWLDVLRESATLAPDHDDAIVREDEHDGIVLASLSLTALALRPDRAVALRTARLPEPGHLPATLDWLP